MTDRPFQDYYAESLSHCYGCGRLNDHGLHIESRWDGEEAVCILEPKPYHVSLPGYVYGGLIASVIDCHCVGTAAAAVCRADGRSMEAAPALRFVTASLKVEYLRPTPLGVPLEVRARPVEIRSRKVVVAATLFAGGQACARGEVVAVRMPEGMAPAGAAGG